MAAMKISCATTGPTGHCAGNLGHVQGHAHHPCRPSLSLKASRFCQGHELWWWPIAAVAVARQALDWEEMAMRTEASMKRICSYDPAAHEVQAVQDELGRLAKQEDSEEGATARAQMDAQHAKVTWYEQLFQETRSARLRGVPEPDVDWNLMADRINKRFKYKPGRGAFIPTQYTSYEDWFLRKLDSEMHDACLARAKLASICAPAQGKMYPQVLSGQMTLKISVIAVEELLGILHSEQLLQIGLRWPDYHRLHSPVDGDITGIDVYQKDQLFAGAESMTIMSIITEFGMIRLLCIGEWSVQTFVTHVVVGQRVRKMDELGYFDLGSQVILALPSSANMLVKGGSKLFVGDPVAICQSRLAQGE
ncbi:unnamed protein product, partial [Effrenium voratum]